MVAVVQLVEHQVVILGVAGSSPVSHPKCPSLALGLFQFSACRLASSSSERARPATSGMSPVTTNSLTPSRLPTPLSPHLSTDPHYLALFGLCTVARVVEARAMDITTPTQPIRTPGDILANIPGILGFFPLNQSSSSPSNPANADTASDQ